jgi:2,3-bisphosphoglycerate-dependent phosphoglycerate mutase
MSILLVRHGETDNNAARVVQMPDAPLSERGLAQAARLAARLAGLGVEAIVASDYARALATAERVRLATGAPLEIWPELRERHLGDLRGRAYADIGFDIFAPDYAPPGGESWAQFHDRVARAWERVRARSSQMRGNLAVISHGLVCRSVVQSLTPVDASAKVPEAWGNTSLTVLGARPPHEIALLNCTAHLAGLEAPELAVSGRA